MLCGYILCNKFVIIKNLRLVRMKLNLLGALDEYSSIIKILPVNMQAALLEGIEELKDNNIIDYGRRFVSRAGCSAIITTSHVWEDAYKNNKLQDDTFSHMSEEILKVQKNNLSVITRSSDKITSEYLKTLESIGLNNGLVKYHFYKSHIEISYFVLNKDNAIGRDHLLNKILLLERAEKKMLVAINSISNTKLFQQKNKIVINPNIANAIFNNKTPLIHEVDFCFSKLNYREVNYLALLNFECGNRFIAKRMQLSESTVKLDLINLKNKLNIENRADLIRIAQNPEIIQKAKMLGIL